MQKKRLPFGDIAVTLEKSNISGKKVLKFNIYADEIRKKLQSGNSESDMVLYLTKNYDVTYQKAFDSVTAVIDIIKYGKEISYESIIENNGQLHSNISGFSMYPMLKNERDSVVVFPLSRKIKKYDVILYKRNGKYILHRIIKITENGYIIRGDNCFFSETDISDGNIIGILAYFYRNGRKYSVNNLLYKGYSRIWVFIYPIRYFLRKSRLFLSKTKNLFIKKHGNNA